MLQHPARAENKQYQRAPSIFRTDACQSHDRHDHLHRASDAPARPAVTGWWVGYAFSCGRFSSGIWDSSWRSCSTAVGTVKPVGPTLTQHQRPSLTTGTPALAMPFH